MSRTLWQTEAEEEAHEKVAIYRVPDHRRPE